MCYSFKHISNDSNSFVVHMFTMNYFTISFNHQISLLCPIPDEEGGNTYLCNGNLIPVGLAGISMVASAVSTLEEEPAAEDATQEQPPPEEPKPKTIKRTRRNAH